MTTAVQHDAALLRRLELRWAWWPGGSAGVPAERALAVDPTLRRAGLMALTHLAAVGPERSADLAVALGIDNGAVSRQVQHLVELGLVERAPDPEDVRAALLAVTAEGRRRLARVSGQRRDRLGTRLVDWTPAELEQFVDLLARYNRSLA